MKENYTYPLNSDWSTAELIRVMEMWQMVEKAYETGIDIQQFNASYREFKTVVRSIGEEKRLGKEFEKLTGYSLYRAVHQAKQTAGKILKMKVGK